MRKHSVLGIGLVVFMILVGTAEAGARFSFNFNFGVPHRRHPPTVVHPRPYYAPPIYVKPYRVWVPGQWCRTPWGWQYAPGYWRSW